MKKLLGLTAASVLFATSHAMGADMAVKAPPPVAVPVPFSWAGYYIGVSGGGVWADNPVDPAVSGRPGANASQVQAAVAAARFHRQEVDGIMGLDLGYNWLFNRWLAGVEADFSITKLDQSVVQNTLFGNVTKTITSTLNRELDELGTVRGRLGFLATDQLLIYGTGGLAYGRVPASYDVASPDGGGGAHLPFNVIATGPSWRAGWAAGGGFEYAFWNHWTARVEYLHYDLGSDTLTVTNTIAVSNFTSTVRPSFSGDLVRFGLNLKL